MIIDTIIHLTGREIVSIGNTVDSLSIAGGSNPPLATMITVHHEIKQEGELYTVSLHFVQDGTSFDRMYPREWKDGSFSMSNHKTEQCLVTKEKALELLDKQITYFESFSKPKNESNTDS